MKIIAVLDGSQVVCVDGEWKEWFMNERVVRESEEKK